MPTRLFDFLSYQLKHCPLDNVLNTKYDGEWKSTSTVEYASSANLMTAAFLNLKIRPKDKIAMISSNNRSEWCIIDIGILQTGAINVPIYPTISEKDYEYILNHSESKYCFVSDQGVYDKIIAIKKNVKNLIEIYSFDDIPGCKNWTELLTLGENNLNEELLNKAKDAIRPDDLATIIYTSGTTGIPKGVMLSHQNVVSNVLSASKRLPLEIGKSTALSFLPICHIFERVILYIYLFNGIKVYFAESIETISDDLKDVKPEVMTAVPRLLEKVFDKIYAKGEELNVIKKKLFYWAVEIGLQFEPYSQNGFWYEIKLKIAKKTDFI
jgi:long-chain acyl-CoA synthetase